MDNSHKKTNLRRTWWATLPTAAALLCAGLFTSCINDDEAASTSGQDTYVNLSFKATRAADTNPATDDESRFKSMRVWAFSNGSGDDALPLSYTEETGLDGNGMHTISMKLPRNVVDANPEIDLYILANGDASTLTGTDNKLKTRAQLKAATIGDAEHYGVNADHSAHTMAVPEGGLPMSRAVTKININAFKSETPNPSKSVDVKLHRAVSKIHFFFARKANAGVDGASITGVEVNANQIPASELAFPAEEQYSADMADRTTAAALPTDAKFDNAQLNYGATAATDIKTLNDGVEPNTYVKKADETAEAYMARLSTAGISGHYLTYIRETDKAVTGKIKYKLSANSSEQTADFTIAANDMLRNREVVVYAYFSGGRLVVNPMVLPWNVVTSKIGWAAKCEVFPWKYSYDEKKTDKENADKHFGATATGGDQDAKYCMVFFPGYEDKTDQMVLKTHFSYKPEPAATDIIKGVTTGAAFYFRLDAPAGAVWKAHLTNTSDFTFLTTEHDTWTGKSKDASGTVTSTTHRTATTGIARTQPYQIKVGAVNSWFTFPAGSADDSYAGQLRDTTDPEAVDGKEFNGTLTPYGTSKINDMSYRKYGIYTDLYVTVSLDGKDEYRLVINPKNAGGMYKDGRRFCGTDTEIRLFQLPAIYKVSYENMQKGTKTSDYFKKYFTDYLK